MKKLPEPNGRHTHTQTAIVSGTRSKLIFMLWIFGESYAWCQWACTCSMYVWNVNPNDCHYHWWQCRCYRCHRCHHHRHNHPVHFVYSHNCAHHSDWPQFSSSCEKLEIQHFLKNLQEPNRNSLIQSKWLVFHCQQFTNANAIRPKECQTAGRRECESINIWTNWVDTKWTWA